MKKEKKRKKNNKKDTNTKIVDLEKDCQKDLKTIMITITKAK